MDATDRSIGGLPWRTAFAYLAIFVAALAVYTALWANTPGIDGDSPQYLEVAKDLSDLHLDTLHDRTVGYPILLALTGSTDHPTRSLLVVSLLLHFVSVWLLAVVLRSAGVASRWLILFGFLLVLPLYVEPAGFVMTENLAQFTLVVGFACLVLRSSRRGVLLPAMSGLAFGYAALTRPAYQALPLVLAACVLAIPLIFRGTLYTRPNAVKTAGVLLAASLLLVGGMSWVNYARFNYPGLVPSIGFHLSTKTMAFVERLPDEYAPVREILIRERNAQLVKRGSYHTGSQTIWSVRSELCQATGLSKTDLSSYLLKMNLRLIAKAPVEYLQEVARSLAVYWFPAAGPLATMKSRVLRWCWSAIYLAVVAFFFLQCIVLVGVGAFELSKRLAGAGGLALDWARVNASQATTYGMAGAIVFYTMVLTCFIDIGEPRQRRPTDVLIVFMCFLGGHVWARTVKRLPE